MRALIALLILLMSNIGAFAQGRAPGAVSMPDPFIMGEFRGCGGPWNCNTGYMDTSAKTATQSQAVNTGIRNLVLIVAGQSNRESVNPSNFVPTNLSAIGNLNPYDGKIYDWSDPALGTGYANGSITGSGAGSLSGRIADKFITLGQFDRVILVPIAIGSSSVAQWAPGGILQNRLCAAYARVVARGFGPQTNVTVGIEFGLGETDNGIGTSQAAWTASFNAMVAQVQACGFAGRFFVAVETWLSGATSAPVAAAQAAVVTNTTPGVWASGNIDTLGASFRLAADNTHLNDSGAASAAQLIYNAMHASGAPY